MCNNAKHACEEEEVIVKGAPYGAACGRKGDCQPRIADETGAQVDNPQWPACVNAQCETGLCNEPACSKNCTLTKDQSDWAGNPGPDGVDDKDASFNDCAGAQDGPMKGDYTCVALLGPDQGNPVNWCLPGTTFKPCKTSTDCPGTETCQLQFVLGTYESRCAASPKGAVSVGEACNRNPEEGDIAFCDTTLCFGVGCTGFCESDTDCLSDTCAGGKCTKGGGDCANDGDCSHFECKFDFDIFGDPQAQTFNICLGKVCETNASCPGDSYCAISGNGKQGADIEWEHICASPKKGASSLGGECEDNANDNIPKPECNGVCLTSGVCSGICNEDADCGAAKGFLCNAIEVPVDYEDDGVDDKVLPLGLCFDFSGSNADCKKDGDCGSGEACNYYQFFSAEYGFDGKGICVTVEPGQGNVGDACGGNSGVTCGSGFCLASQDDQPGYCSTLCSSGADCPQGITLGLFQGTYNLMCRGLMAGQGLDPNAADDNTVVPLCVPVSADTSSLNDCSADKGSCPATQGCLALAIALGQGPATLEYKCVGNGGFDAQNNPVAATAGLGAKCDVTGGDEGGPFCNELYCLQDTTGGYCGAFCDTNADCTAGGPDMVCSPFVVLDQLGTDGDAIINLCQKQKSCIPCDVDTDCAGGNICVNTGGIGLLEDRRCAPPCAESADCNGTDGGDTCSDSIDKSGQSEGKMACIPSGC